MRDHHDNPYDPPYPDDYYEPEPPDLDYPRPFTRWEIWDRGPEAERVGTSRYQVTMTTDDDEDTGYPGEVVVADPLYFESLEGALKITGVTRRGVLADVTVLLNGNVYYGEE